MVPTTLFATFLMHHISIPPFSLFSRNGYLQHARHEWDGIHCIRYHMYRIMETEAVGDAINFAHGNSFPSKGGNAPTQRCKDKWTVSADDVPDKD